MIHDLKNSRGVTLVEMAIAIAVLGILLAGYVSIINQRDNRERLVVTELRQKRVVQALADYVEAAYRLPCPADPAANNALFGWERGVTLAQTYVSNTRPTGSCGPADMEGIVPFQTLNLSYNDILDGWGRPFTYAVSPVFAQRNDRTADGGGESGGNVHNRCRVASWVRDGVPRNAPKARFCCAGYGHDASAANVNHLTDIRIEPRLALGTAIMPIRDTQGTGATANYGAIDQLLFDARTLLPRPNTSGNIAAPAFVLISHGQNAYGAYMLNNTANRVAWRGSGAASVGEIENQNATVGPNERRTFATGYLQLGSTNYFDDIVVWMTQDGIMAYNGASSCNIP